MGSEGFKAKRLYSYSEVSDQTARTHKADLSYCFAGMGIRSFWKYCVPALIRNCTELHLMHYMTTTTLKVHYSAQCDNAHSLPDDDCICPLSNQFLVYIRILVP